jgi:hypothetical protein
MEERLSGLPMTDPHNRIGAVKDTAIRMPTQEIRQVDGGMWKGPSLRNDEEKSFVQYLKLQKKMNPNQKMVATRGSFIEALEKAYRLGKGGL